MSNHWNHRIMVHQQGDELIFMIHEVHYADGVPLTYTSHGVRVVGDDVTDIAEVLANMLLAVSKPVLWYGDRFPDEYTPIKDPDPPSHHEVSNKPT